MTSPTNTRVADYLALCVFGRSHDELWGGEGTLASKVMSGTFFFFSKNDQKLNKMHKSVKEILPVWLSC